MIALGAYALLGGFVSFLGWALDVPRLTDWLQDGVAIQPNACVLIMTSGTAVLLIQWRIWRVVSALAAVVGIVGFLTLLQHILGADLGFNHQLLFGRTWGGAATVSPGMFGPPASASFTLFGTALAILAWAGLDPRRENLRRIVPACGTIVCVLMTFSLLGYLFEAEEFYSIPWLTAIALPTGTMLLAVAIGLVLSVPECDPLLMLSQRSGAGTLSRIAIPTLIVMIPAVSWLRIWGVEEGHYDLGTGRALGAIGLMMGSVGVLWIALTALRREDDKLSEASRRKDEFLATLAHELRNPLAPIRSGIEILTSVRDNPAAVAETLEIMKRQTTQLIRLVDDLMEVSRITRGKLELRKAATQLTDIVQSAVEASQPQMDEARHQFDVEMPEQPVFIEVDPHRLAQVISNLLNNAARYTPAGGRMSLTVHQQEDQVVISVRDNGVGIPADMLDRIFEMFAQVEPSAEGTQTGLGIGLTLVKTIVSLHGGGIEAHSNGPDHGSEFCIRLPTVAAGAVAASSQVEAVQTPATNERHRVLVVDDNQGAARTLSLIIQRLGYEVRTAFNGREAVAVASQFHPELILMDLGMPIMNGYDAAHSIRQQPWGKNIRLAALTGWNQDQHKQRAKEAGFDHHLVKPADLQAVKALLTELDRRPSGGSVELRT